MRGVALCRMLGVAALAIVLLGFGPLSEAAAATDSTADDDSLAVSIDSLGRAVVKYGAQPIVAGAPEAGGVVVAGKASAGVPSEKGSYDATASKFTQKYAWGQWSVENHYHAENNTLDFVISVLNSAANDTIQGISIYPFGIGAAAAFTFPGCNATGCYKMHSTTDIEHYVSPCWGSWTPLPCPLGVAPPQCTPTTPQIILADYGSGAMLATLPANGQIHSAAHVVLGFTLDQDPSSLAYGGFNLQLNFTALPPASNAHTQLLSLRFAPGSDSSEGQDWATTGGSRRLLGLANDTLQEFRQRVPSTVNWPQRGPIGALFFDNCGAGCNCNTTLPADCPNPRGWNANFGGAGGVNTTNAAGRAIFREKLLAFVNQSVDYCTTYMSGAARCQGILVWSLEGQEFPQDISYIGSPDLLPTLA